MSKKKGLTAFGIASTYVGTVIGAGYASGQEILQFFSAFRDKGLISLTIATVLFIAFAHIPMLLGKRLNCGDYEKVISIGKSRIPQIFADILITFTLFGTLTIMIAASGTTFNQSLGVPMIVGGVFMTILLIVSLLAGLDGIVKALSAVVPVMVVTAFGMSIYYMLNPMPVVDVTKEVVINASPLIKHWSLSGVLYVSFNLIVSIAILVSMGQMAEDEKNILQGSVFGGLILGLCAMALNFALVKNIHVVGNADLPMVELAKSISSTMGSIYSVVLFLGLYSTAISCFYGVYVRFSKSPVFSKLGNKTIILFISVISLCASMLGFANLIGYIYPLIGYGGIIIMILTTVILMKNSKEKVKDSKVFSNKYVVREESN